MRIDWNWIFFTANENTKNIPFPFLYVFVSLSMLFSVSIGHLLDWISQETISTYDEFFFSSSLCCFDFSWNRVEIEVEWHRTTCVMCARSLSRLFLCMCIFQSYAKCVLDLLDYMQWNRLKVSKRWHESTTTSTKKSNNNNNNNNGNNWIIAWY